MKRPPVYLLQKIPGLWLFVVMISALPVYAHIGPNTGNENYAVAILSIFSGGDGTEANPYQIENVDQLQRMKDHLASHFTLIADIDAAATAGWNGNAGFEPVGAQAQSFTGSLKGNGYKITGLVINRPETDYIGLFGRVAVGGSITDVALEDIDMKGRLYIGGLVGYNDQGTITSGSATGRASGLADVGGLVGGNNLGTITFSYATVSVSGNLIGGLVGYHKSGTITSCYATGSVWGTDGNVGGLVGSFVEGTITSCYAAGSVSDIGAYVGGLVGYNHSGTITDCYWNKDATGQDVGVHGSASSVLGLADLLFRSQDNFNGFDFTNDWAIDPYESYPYLRNNPQNPPPGYAPFAGGDGTEANPYRIENVDQLQRMKNHLAGHFILIADINAVATAGWNGTAGFEPIGSETAPFTGSLDGAGYQIMGLTINRPAQNAVSLFGRIGTGAKIMDVVSVDVNIEGNNGVGGLVGQNNGDATIKFCAVTGSVSGEENVGGLVGANGYGTISTSYATASVSGNRSVGGLVGRHDGSIATSYAMGDVSGREAVGGLVGTFIWGPEALITTSYAAGRVSATDSDAGGFVGMSLAEATITYSYWNTDATGQDVGVNGPTSGSWPLGFDDLLFRHEMNFNGFDFTNDWTIGGDRDESYPYLRNNPQTPSPGYTEPFLPENGVLYVKKDATGNGMGNSWANAIPELADALKWVRERRDRGLPWDRLNPLQIWVANGTYQPRYHADDGRYGTDGGRYNSFVLVPNVQLYGGFDPDNGIDDLTDERRLPDVSSGGTGGTVLAGDDAYHVIISSGPVGEARLDGFTVTGGKADGSETVIVNTESIGSLSGGGMYIGNSSPTLANVSISGNQAYFSGGGLFNIDAAPTLRNVSISANVVTGVTGNGGGMYNRASATTLRNVVISGNRAAAAGGIYNEIAAATGALTLTNVTISGNIATANTSAGEWYNDSGTPIIRNSIIYGNGIAGDLTNNQHSLLQGRSDTENGNLDYIGAVEDLFASPAGGNYRLLACSPAVDGGSNQFYEDADGDPEQDNDLAGGPRVVGDAIDMGAYELQGEKIDYDEIVFTDAEAIYNGTSHTIIATNLPPGIDVSYGLFNAEDEEITEAIHAGRYAVKATFSGCGLGRELSATLTVLPKELVITAKDGSKIYGEVVAFDGTEFTVDGLVNNDEVTSVTLTSNGASATALVDGYDIAAADGAGHGSWKL